MKSLSIQKVLALIAVLMGILMAISHYYYFTTLLSDRINNGLSEYEKPLGYFDLKFSFYIPLFAGFAYLLGGILLLLNKAPGWFLLVFITLYNFVQLTYTALFDLEVEKDWLEYVFIALLFLGNSTFFLLFNKATMQKFNLGYVVIPILLGVAIIAHVFKLYFYS